MLFNSIPFLLFAIIFFLLWPLFNKRNTWRWFFLVIMSFIFYAWWDWRFLFLIIGSGLLDYFCGLGMVKKPAFRKTLLLLSLAGNLGCLTIFKYSLFYAGLIDTFFHTFNISISLKDNIPDFALILPVGISFYTFQSMSYTIDIYRGKINPTRNVFHFFSYLAMFPQLVAGPIIRAKDFLIQLSNKRTSTALQKWHAIKLIVFGLFQKMVIADNIGFMVDSAYQGKGTYDGSIFWLCVIVGFAFQIYCDFSGYSLIARGLAKYMGYHFKMNFNHPYHSTSLRDFWNRWHISLSTWFRDYVYIPLGGSRKGYYAGIFFLTITMVVSGLWHGANYTFLFWGFLHALFLGFERITKWPHLLQKFSMGKQISIFIVFVQVLFSWNYFRAENITQANMILQKLISFDLNLDFALYYFNPIFFLCFGILIEYTIYLRRNYFVLNSFYTKFNLDIVITACALSFCIFFRGPEAQFIYFQF